MKSAPNCLAAVLVALVVAVHSTCSSGQLFGGLFKQADPLKRISSYLEANLESDDHLGPNLDLAKRWYESTYGGDDSSRAKKSKFAPKLREFLQLEQTLQVDSCNREGHQILSSLERQLIASSGANSNHRADNKLARVDTIIRDAQLEHAKLCSDRYRENYAKLVAESMSVDQGQLELVGSFLPDELILNWLHGNSFLQDHGQPFESLVLAGDVFRLGFKSVCDRHTRKQQVVAQLMLDTIRAHSSKEADGKLAHRCLSGQQQQLEKIKAPASECPAEARRLFKKYIQEPCQAYVHELGPDVFQAHRYDLRSYMPAAGPAADARNPDKYQLAWARYEYCHSMDDLAEGLAKEVASLMMQSQSQSRSPDDGARQPVAC